MTSKKEQLIERHKSWNQPEIKEGCYRTGLKLVHSLWPIDPVEFIPVSGRQVNWYTCGPTVYSDTHLGHARCYIVADYIRRILRDYFQYEVNYVMNITDIDDKIINKSIELGIDFVQFARKWEKDYFHNMDLLGVQPPNRLVRVTEYVPEIVKFIEKIIKNGYAYEANGSVYFDVSTFTKAGHHYCKLEPTSFNEENKDLEGNQDKKSPSDFALWKKVKEGEPSWPSPWGSGRPGWHIECSCMVDEAFNNIPTIDLHYGGADLKFPHHDNEIAQSEAFYDCKQWINYFLHCGQLYSKGQKMSKSLKNYFTVKDVLSVHNARELRMMFLMHQYDSLLNYDESTSFLEPGKKDSIFHNFNLNAQVYIRRGMNLDNPQKFDEEERELEKDFVQRRTTIHEHLCNNLNTPDVIEELAAMVHKMNVYFKRPEDKIKTTIVQSYHTYVMNMLKLFGLEYTKESAGSGNQDETNALIDSFRQFRDDVIVAAGLKEPKAIFDLTDKLRDEVLPNFGVKIEDKGKGKPSTWKKMDKDELLKEIAKKKEDAQKLKEEKEKKARELEEKMKREPKDIFNDPDYKKFAIGKYDEKGIPTHNTKGDEFAPKVRAAFEKDFAKQEKIRNEWLEKNKDKQPDQAHTISEEKS
jgi:cysteinyl-tRNA synthetase